MMSQKMLMSVGSVSLTIAATVRNPDIRALALATGWNGSGAITLKINSGVDVASLIIPATIPNGALTLINYGRIGGVFNSGTALVVRTGIVIYNYGTMFGGGGAGGKGGDATVNYHTQRESATGGAGGNGAGFTASGSVTMLARTAGQSGTTSYYTGAISGGTTPYATSGAGGAGGDIGVAGSNGGYGTYGGTAATGGTVGSVGQGAAAGYYIDGNSYVDWKVAGTRLGNVI